MDSNLISQRNSHSHLMQVAVAASNEDPGIGLSITGLSENLHTHHVLVVDDNSARFWQTVVCRWRLSC